MNAFFVPNYYINQALYSFLHPPKLAYFQFFDRWFGILSVW